MTQEEELFSSVSLEHPLRLLILEDVPDDAVLIEHELKGSGIPFFAERADSRDQFVRKIDEFRPHAILADFALPQFTALDALEIVRQRSIDIPFIVVTGSQTDEAAVKCMKAGADDYVLKMSLKRLPAALRNALAKRNAEHEKEVIHRALESEILERRRAERALGDLSRRLLEVQEAERRHIARELHDEIGQALSAVKINLQAAQRLPDAKAVTARLQESVEIVDQVVVQVRNLSLDLRPSILDDLGIGAALRWYLDRVAQRSGFTAHCSTRGFEDRLPASIETACFRVAQEALTNIVRHARAKDVHIELQKSTSSVHLIITDDGVGFDTDEAKKRGAAGASLGLLGMQERVALVGGIIKINSSPGQGTEIIVHFPCSVT